MQSGIVESYALGLATPVEREEFEQLLPHYPELKDALTEFEYQLELFSLDNEVLPPPDVRQKIVERIRRGHGMEYVQAKETSSYIRVHRIWRTLFIIVFVLSKIFLILAIYYFLEWRHAEKQLYRAPAPAARQN